MNSERARAAETRRRMQTYVLFLVATNFTVLGLVFFRAGGWIFVLVGLAAAVQFRRRLRGDGGR